MGSANPNSSVSQWAADNAATPFGARLPDGSRFGSSGAAARGAPVLTRFVVGCAPLGGLYSPVSEDDGQAMLQRAWNGGVRCFDVAPLYGLGLAERRLGAFLSRKPREEFVLSTKVGRLLVPGEGNGSQADSVRAMFDFSADGIRRSLEASLERLGLDRVDIALIHDPDNHFSQAIDMAYPALEGMRAAGTVRSIGVGMNQADMLERFVRETDIDVVLVAGRYSLLDDRAGRGLLPAASDRHVAVLVAGVFNGDILADPRSGARFDYRPASAELVARAKALGAIAAEHHVPLTRVAMQFPLRNSAVSGVVVGCRSSDEVASNLAEFTASVPDALWSDLDKSGLIGWAGLPEGEAQRF